MKASDLFVRALEAEGVEFVFGIPGEENLDLLESLRGSKIRLVIGRHEQAAGFMAATYGRLTGNAGVCLSTLGPGATNLVTAAAYAQLGAMPMVMVTGQKPIKSSKQGRFQIIDIVDMMQPLTKFTKVIVSGDNVPAHVREAFRQAEEERPGATHLELPEDIAREHSTMPVLEPSYTRRPIAENKAVCQAVQAIAAARKPLLLIGAGANRKLTAKMLREFVEKFGIPAVTTQMGKGVIDEASSHFIGNTALSDGDFVHRAIDQADLIINVGHDVVEKPPFFMRPGGPEVVHINFSSAQVDPVYFPQIEVVGDIANSLWQIKEKLEPQSHWSFTDAHRIRDALRKHIVDGAQDASFPVKTQRLVKEVREAVPDNGIIALDNGMYKIWFARNYQAHKPNTVLLDNALATMGAGLPSAMAAKLVHPDRSVVAICGDGGFMMNSQELETAVRLKLDLVILILRDDGYGMIKWKQSQMDFHDFGLDFGNPDFVAYAESYGASGHRIERTEDVRPTIERCMQEGGIHLIDIPMDYSDNDRILNREIRELSAKL
ncbi:acetolactate synthase large subunit [Microbulbifer agarilyticus]|uniref:acetolactate synthase large subunit n=1 Tax=Microbulbifer agarilyticus TaxID=260552 RepID=UPI001C98DAFC|nr:acetolactate synthase large subunit [Microbulbifer agarilyticus]